MSRRTVWIFTIASRRRAKKTYSYYMAGSASGENEANPVFWLATRAGKMALSCLLGISRFVPTEANSLVSSFNHIINPLLTKLVRSWWLDIGLVLFFLRFYGPRRKKLVFSLVSKVISRLLWFRIATLCDWLKNLAPLYRPVKSKTKTNRDWPHAFSRISRRRGKWENIKNKSCNGLLLELGRKWQRPSRKMEVTGKKKIWKAGRLGRSEYFAPPNGVQGQAIVHRNSRPTRWFIILYWSIKFGL